MQLKIGELAQKTHVSTATLRYYEQCGLLSRANRADNGYRYYPVEAIQQIEFIKKAQQLGFSLQDIATILQIRQTGQAPCQVVKHLLTEKIAQVQNQLETLKHLEAELLYYQQQWQQEANVSNATGSICHLIEEISIKN
ncbi:MAG TPA: heavy metal-responsive transcriptional regulator [Agitococcus sp.]|nr:heavy metal-responsive transcriptional regulator [Agitococcus sp.]HNC04641.1 heavy metal-responsive transcriptional regulator [Agitococcus sp.]HNE91078.1 heavy metal-responsive transcriptional regulator [Agitococcus sp.]HNH43383.1 heavy metal-responsive transcriptional regulator [Agitococcus sp.]HRH92509.1 heavy metal-responsive transcriptional regulator [Agitococcus sp.]